MTPIVLVIVLVVVLVVVIGPCSFSVVDSETMHKNDYEDDDDDEDEMAVCLSWIA